MDRFDRAARFLHAATVAAALVASAALWWPVSADASQRIKEVASVQGVRPNQLMGYGQIGRAHV